VVIIKVKLRVRVGVRLKAMVKRRQIPCQPKNGQKPGSNYLDAERWLVTPYAYHNTLLCFKFRWQCTGIVLDTW